MFIPPRQDHQTEKGRAYADRHHMPFAPHVAETARHIGNAEAQKQRVKAEEIFEVVDLHPRCSNYGGKWRELSELAIVSVPPNATLAYRPVSTQSGCFARGLALLSRTLLFGD